MRISDWSSDVCSSDLRIVVAEPGDVWFFAYGSLMWDPGFVPREVRPALLRGWHRRFCVRSGRYRGTRSEERRVGKGCVRKCRTRRAPYHITQKKQEQPITRYKYIHILLYPDRD